MNELISNFFSASNFSFTVPLFELLSSFLLNTIVVFIIIHFLYYPKGRRRDYYFTFLMLSISIFMLIYLLLGNSSDMGIGAALGLFAIFGIIRYRTESVPIREMTYLFFLVALSVLNAKSGDINFLGRLVINGVMILTVWGAERLLSNHKEGCKFVKYDNIELIKPEKHEELKQDLEARLGVKVTRVEVGAVDFLTDMTMLRVFYEDPNKEIKSVDRLIKINQENGF
jgi:hypothetical protein